MIYLFKFLWACLLTIIAFTADLMVFLWCLIMYFDIYIPCSYQFTYETSFNLSPYTEDLGHLEFERRYKSFYHYIWNIK